jgi:uncharacterized RDD family membrane protein YckC
MGHLPLELRDQLSIETPELVSLEFSLAGLGSRGMACVADYALQFAVLLVILIGLAIFAALVPHAARAAVSEKSAHDAEVWTTAIFVMLIFLFQWGYFGLFEAFWNGQTPGKRLLKLRVIQQSGRQVNLFQSLSRNLLRFVDALPGVYAVGIVFLFASKRSQRLGDLVAGTLVVHARAAEAQAAGAGRVFTGWIAESAPQERASLSTGLAADVIGRLHQGDLEVLENFNARRLDLPYATATALAARLAAQMAAKMGAALPAGMSPETFLEAVADEMRALGQARRG